MRPTRRLILLLLCGVPAAALPALLGSWAWVVWCVALVVCLLLGGLDGIVALRPRRLDCAVTTPESIHVGDEDAARVRLAAPRRGAVDVELHLDLSGDVAPVERVLVRVAGGEPAVGTLPLRPRRRGTFRIDALWLRWRGPLGLMRRLRRVRIGREVRVVTNMPRVWRGALAYLEERDAWTGLKVVRHEGEGSEFEALREHMPGMDARTIHWRASARHRKLISVEHRAERNHQVVVAFDVGYLQRELIDGIPKLDHAIHAGLALAYTALKTGDRVGLYAFGADARLWIAPRGGVQAFTRLQHAAGRLDYSTEETNFTLGITRLASELRRRSLVIILTDFVDTVTAELLVDNARRLARRHVLLFVSLRDPELEALLAERVEDVDDITRALVADDLLRERDRVMRRLRQLGILTIDVPPDRVTTDLLNRYMRIKRRELV